MARQSKGAARRDMKTATELLYYEIPTKSGAWGTRKLYTDYAAMIQAAIAEYAGFMVEKVQEKMDDDHRPIGWIRIVRVPLKVGEFAQHMGVDPVTGIPLTGTEDNTQPKEMSDA